MMKDFLDREGAKAGPEGVYFPAFERVPQSVAAMASVIAFGAVANGNPGAYLDAAIADLAGDEHAPLREALGIYRRVLNVQLQPVK